MARSGSTRAVEDYLKVIFNLGEWEVGDRSNADLAARLGVSTSSASEMVRKLTEAGLVDHEPYGDIELTAQGRRRAVEMVRRHRLIETYLVEALGYSWDEVHSEAEVLEHAVSPLMVDRMDAVLGRPWRDPHGDPIPTADGTVHQPVARLLFHLQPGELGYVARIGDEDPRLLRWFTDRGIRLDQRVVVKEHRPFGGPLVAEFTIEGQPVAVESGLQAAAALWVAEERPSAVSGDGRDCPYPRCRHLS